ncbi:hypothetical protein [Blastococcus atacamensis]|uniref:hypothetical protein n=1 Tax=Blastococcus atacamensis TaxID=2070508 RepID=UPI000CEC96CA|nr:hypothetical protein [Blastococcus atacamensis]
MTTEVQTPPPVGPSPRGGSSASRGRRAARSRWTWLDSEDGWRSARPWLLPLAALAVGVLWLWSLRGVRLEEMGGWGLLSALPLSWYLAFTAVLLLYLGTLLSRRALDHGLAACHVALVAILFATPSLVYEVPRYPWTFKHIGVTEYLLENWTVDRSIDIYHNFPGFFYLAAGISRATGIDVEGLAQWSQPVLALLTAAAVYWMLGGLTTSRRTRYGAVLIFTLGDWIGQNYFAPQAFAFPLSLLVLGGLLRTVTPGQEGFRWPWVARRFAFPDDADLPQASAFWRSRWGAALLIAGFVVVVVSHPLSPLILLAQITLVCVILRPARPWLPAVFLALEEAWLLQAWPFLNSTYDLFDFGLRNISPPQVSVTEPLPGYEVALFAAPLLMVVVALLTLWGGVAAFFWRARAPRVLVPLIIAAVPMGMVLGQPYGNEGIFRAYLFALPFLAFVIAMQLFDEQVTWTPERRLLAGMAVALVAFLTLPANFASELTHRVAASDVAADRWFEENAPEGSVLLPFTSSYPWRSTAEYPEMLPAPTVAVDGISELPGFQGVADGPTALVTFTRDACDTRAGTGPVYVALGPSAEADVRLLGTMQLFTYRAFEREIAADPDFEEVFREGDSVLYRCRA